MKKHIVLAMIIAILAGCAVTRTQPPVAVYDFGLQQLPLLAGASDASSTRQPSTSLFVAEAIAPQWLDNTAIHYRLAYDDLAQLHAYSSSRWAAAPAALLTQRFRARLAAADGGVVMSAGEGARTDYTLRLELEEFTQIFDTPDRSRAVVRFRASLINRPTRSLTAQRSFGIERPAPAENAAGAVLALTEGSDKLIGDLIDWVAQELPSERVESLPEGQGL